MKNLKLKKMNVVQTANVSALLYAPIAIIYILMGVGMYALGGDMVGSIVLGVMGLILPLIGWVFVSLLTLILNLAFKITGGVTLTFEEETNN